MEVYAPQTVVHFPTLLRHEPVIMDSSSIMTYKTCPRMYLLRIILGFVPKDTPPYFGFGSAYHKFKEVLERQHMAGAEARECFKAGMIAGLTSFEQSGVDPKLGSKYQWLTKDRLLQSMKVAFDWWLLEKKDKRITVLSVEQSMIVQMPDGTWIAGRADQIVKWNGEVWGRDFKTTTKDLSNHRTLDYYSRGIEPNDQFTRYTYMESVLGGAEADLSNTKLLTKGQIVETLWNTDTKGPKILNFQTRRTHIQLKQWMQDHEFWMGMIHKSRELDNYPMNEKACSFCAFHSVCKMDSESAQLYQLQANFRIEPWDCTAHSETSES